jgi:hypothetical protein
MGLALLTSETADGLQRAQCGSVVTLPIALNGPSGAHEGYY